MKTKTNAMRMLDSANIQYGTCEYEVDEDDLSALLESQLDVGRHGVHREVALDDAVVDAFRSF